MKNKYPKGERKETEGRKDNGSRPGSALCNLCLSGSGWKVLGEKKNTIPPSSPHLLCVCLREEEEEEEKEGKWAFKENCWMFLLLFLFLPSLSRWLFYILSPHIFLSLSSSSSFFSIPFLEYFILFFTVRRRVGHARRSYPRSGLAVSDPESP